MAGSVGIDVRHRKGCARPRQDGKCCGASFQAHVFDARTNQRIRKTWPTRTEAKLWRQDMLVAIRQGHVVVQPNSATVAEALDRLVTGMKDGTILDRSGRQYRPATIRDYERDARRYLKPALGRYRVTELKRGQVQALVDKLHREGLTGSTIRNKLDPLRVVYRRAMQDEEVTSSPAEKLRLPALTTKPRPIAAREHAVALIDALPPDQRALWSCAIYGGLRVGELRALRWENVDFEQGVIRVVAGWDDVEGEQDPKTYAGLRVVPLVGRVRDELRALLERSGRGPGDLVFGRTPRDAFTRSTMRIHALKAWGWTQVPNDKPTGARKVWVKAHDAALDPLTPHGCRHTCASYLAAAGLTPKEAQTAMGHADIRTTLNIYAKAVPGWESAAAAKLDAYLDS